jgi:hypothetical protein
MLQSMSHGPVPDEHERHVSRRAFLALAGIGILSGCASTQQVATLPDVPWPPERPRPRLEPVRPRAGAGMPAAPAPDAPGMPGVIARSRWAKGQPVPALMNRLGSVRHITVHHDGMSAFYGATEGAAAERLERIRIAHRARGWGDIGYHFGVDRSGAVWELRPVAFQGAHVKDFNESNIGVVTLGNFDEQTPTEAQLASINRHVSALMRAYRVHISNVRTHQEWAPTACPGRNLQAYMVASRHNGRLG